MQTLRKLPTMERSTKNTTDQKWNGTADQTCQPLQSVAIRKKAINAPLRIKPQEARAAVLVQDDYRAGSG